MKIGNGKENRGTPSAGPRRATVPASIKRHSGRMPHPYQPDLLIMGTVLVTLLGTFMAGCGW